MAPDSHIAPLEFRYEGNMIDTQTATRPVLWNISHDWVMYVLFAASLIIAGYGLYRRLSVWRRGVPADRFDRPAERLGLLLRHAAAQSRTVRERYAAVFHTFIYTGFIILFIATTVVMVDHRFGVPIMRGAFYLYFQSLIVDLFGGLVLVGIAIAYLRRVVLRPKKLVYTTESNRILALIFLMAVTGFLVEGWRIAATADPWGAWSPIGYLVGGISASLMSVEAMTTAHRWMWWLHAGLVFGFIAWVPYTKLIHILTGPLNIYTARLDPSGKIVKTLDFENPDAPLGVKTLGHFTWKDLADFDACTECGRCTSVCPANTVGKSLSPRDLILDLRNLIRNSGPELAFEQPVVNAVAGTSTEALWECTTCGACMEACPVFIEQMPKIVDLRRYLVMEESDFPDTMQEAINAEHSHRLDRRARYRKSRRCAGRRGPLLGRLRRRADRTQSEGRPRDRATASKGRGPLRHPWSRGEVHRRSGAPHRQRIPLRYAGAREYRNAQRLWRQDNRHLMPALLQLLRERISAVRRQLRGLPSQRIPREADRRRPSDADREAGRQGDFSRSMLSWPAQWPFRCAAPTGSDRLAFDRRDGAQPRERFLLRRRRRNELRRRIEGQARQSEPGPGGDRYRGGCRSRRLSLLHDHARGRHQCP